MRWLQRRSFATAVISLLVILCFLWTTRNKLPSNVFEKAHGSFFSGETQESRLAQLLQEFVQRPVLTYDESVQQNSPSCPTEGINFDKGNVRINEQKWRAITSEQISTWRHDIAAYLQDKMNSDSSVIKGQGGRGIVMAAGDHDAAIRARTNIRFLRSYNCTLPVEIFHFPNELSGPDQNLLSDLELESSDNAGHSYSKVTVRVVEGIEKGNGWKAFQIKGAAIQQSSFDEILYLDTDSYLLRNPDSLFDSDHWPKTGLFLWPDYTKSHPTNPLWRLLGQRCRDEYEGESGQIVISRSRHQDVLWLVEYFAIHHDEFYDFMGGDRDSFRAAALLLGKEWNGPGRLNAAAGVLLEGNPRGGGHTMLQADPEGRWMFVHANLIKHGQFPRPLWQTIHRAAEDGYNGTSTYGSIEPPNENLGDGVKLRVDQAPKLVTTMEAFEGYSEDLVVVEEWDSYEDLRGFEEKWFGFGGVHEAL